MGWRQWSRSHHGRGVGDKLVALPAQQATNQGGADLRQVPRKIDLLSLVDAGLSIGTWEKPVGGGLSSDDGEFCTLATLYRPPAEYDLHVVFTRTAGDDTVALIVPDAGVSPAWLMAAFHNTIAGFELIGRKRLTDNPTGVRSTAVLANNRQYDCVVKVRKDSLAAYLDGELLSKCDTDGSDLAAGGWGDWGGVIGVGTYASPTTFQRIEVTEITGTGQVLLPRAEAHNDREIRRLNGHHSTITSVVFSPDGKYLLSNSTIKSDPIRLWDLSSGNNLFAFANAEYGGAERGIFSPDGSLMLIDEAAGRRVRETTTGNILADFHSPNLKLSFSPDGTRIIRWSESPHSAAVWDIRMKTEIICDVHHDAENAVFSQLNWWAGVEEQSVYRVESDTGKLIWKTSALGNLSNLAISADDKKLHVLAQGGTLFVLDAADGSTLAAITNPRTTSVLFTRDSMQMLVSYDDSKGLRLWDTSGIEVLRFPDDIGPVNAMALSPDGSRVLLACVDGNVRLMDAKSGKAITHFTGHRGCVTSVAFAPDGRTAASGGTDRTIRIWRLPSAE